MKIKVKICCISSSDEARMAISSGASALGLVGQMPSGPGVISDQQIAQIRAITPPGVATFLLTCQTTVQEILAHHQRTYTNTIQLVDSLSEGTYQQLREAMPAIKIVQVIHVQHEGSVEEALRVAPQVDALLLDSGNPTLPVKILGGTGKTHDWKLSRKITESVQVPVFLAGGLTAHNVRRAIQEVNPYGLDLCSGLRTDGKLDPYKVEEFFKAIISES